MTLSKSTGAHTMLSDNRELHESVQELDNLLEDLQNAQVSSEQRGYARGTGKDGQQASYYNSSASLSATGAYSATNGGGGASSSSRPSSAIGNQRWVANSSELEREESANEEEQFDEGEERQAIPRGVFVKDVVEEEILVDHVVVPPKHHLQSQEDKKSFITTRPSDRVKGERARRQVAFSEHTSQRRLEQPASAAAAAEEEEDEFYDNTATEYEDSELGSAGQQQQQHYLARRSIKQHQQDQSASMLSLNSGITDQSDMTEGSSILDPNKIINCYVCNGRIVGQVITALNRHYHKEHFTCAHCNKELGTRNFYERDEKPYCERDYQALFSPKCAACGEPILDKVTIALEQTFHPEHFVCAHCGCQFEADDGFHEKDGKPYCKNDFFELFANRCAGCNLPITANYITALSVQWHPDCFVCSDCHCPFGDGKFFDIDGLPYCDIHYHARKGSLCAVCRQPIIGKCTTAMFRKFHPDHFTCTYCLKVLSKTFKEENDKPYCHDCFDKLFS